MFIFSDFCKEENLPKFLPVEIYDEFSDDDVTVKCGDNWKLQESIPKKQDTDSIVISGIYCEVWFV